MTYTKYWCFTSFNLENFDVLREACEDNCTYYVIGKETCGTTGRQHLQGYVEFGIKKRLSAVKSSLRAPDAHFEPRKGNATEASDYCKKGAQSHAEWTSRKTLGPSYGQQADFVEGGNISVSKRGKRTDIENIRDKIIDDEITNHRQLLDHCTSEQAFKFGARYLHTKYTSPFRQAPTVCWIYGGTGCGKSYRAYKLVEQLHENRGWNWWGSKGLHWFDNYWGQEICVFDDFRFNGNNSDFAQLLRITDRYKLELPCKGGFINWEPRFIIFTTCRSIIESFASLGGSEGLEQLERRVGLMEFNFDLEEEKNRFEGLIDRHLTGQESEN